MLLGHISDKRWVFSEVTVRINFGVAVILKKACQPALCTSSLKISTFLITFFGLCSNVLKFVDFFFFFLSIKGGYPFITRGQILATAVTAVGLSTSFVSRFKEQRHFSLGAAVLFSWAVLCRYLLATSSGVTDSFCFL